MERAAQKEAQKALKEAEEEELRQQTIWSVGSNKKGAAKAAAAEAKAAEKARKAKEKLDLQAADEASVATVKKTKKKGKDDHLDRALKVAPKSKAVMEADKKKQEKDARRKAQQEAEEAKAARRAAEEKERAEAARKGLVYGHGDALMATKIVNKLPDGDEESATGLDAAVSLLSVGSKKEAHPEKRRKAAYEAYYAEQLPSMKEQLPGLKLSQYKERIFESWKTAPENPMNQPDDTNAGAGAHI